MRGAEGGGVQQQEVLREGSWLWNLFPLPCSARTWIREASEHAARLTCITLKGEVLMTGDWVKEKGVFGVEEGPTL